MSREQREQFMCEVFQTAAQHGGCSCRTALEAIEAFENVNPQSERIRSAAQLAVIQFELGRK